jgi:DNA-binding MurR/RpiR family transcriptional regulator
MQEKLISKIKSNQAYMSAVEKKIAAVILEDSKKFTTYSLVELSSLIGVSQGSIVNFANKYVGGGFPELKIAVASSKEIEIESEQIQQPLSLRISSVSRALLNTQNENNEELIKEIARLILKAKKVEIYGVYRSAAVATDLYYHLLQLGIHANFVSDVLTCVVSASLLAKDSLVIAVSSSGRTKDVIDAVKLAKENGVKVVCITANSSSPLAKLSDYTLIASSSSDNEFSAYEIRLSQLVLTDAICEHILKELGKNGKQNNQTMKRILDSHNVND